MKMVVAVIKPYKLDEVREALAQKNAAGMTVTEVEGFGRRKGHAQLYRGSEYAIDFLPKVELETAVAGGRVGEAVDAIAETADPGQTGGGKIFARGLERAARIRAGVSGNDAL